MAISNIARKEKYILESYAYEKCQYECLTMLFNPISSTHYKRALLISHFYKRYICSAVYIGLYGYTYTCAQQSTLGVFLNCSTYTFWNRVFHWTWTSLIQPRWTASELQGFSCLYLSMSGVLHGCWGVKLNSGPHAHTASNFYCLSNLPHPNIT